MVKKANEKWRMCVDFTDLNKACPKDSYPLLRIDTLVDSTARNQLLSFMDAFSGYNQIKMEEADQEKTSFVTSQGFVLLQGDAVRTQKCWGDIPEVNEQNVHTPKEDHLDDLRETFNILWSYNMKLNPNKCAFSVMAGKFLGFMVSQRGIEVNPKNIWAIVELEPPRTVKEV